MKDILAFQGPYRWLSNFEGDGLPIKCGMGIEYPTVEHAYQASKFSDPEVRLKISVLPSAAESKKAGRWDHPSRIANFDDMKLEVMRKLLAQKYSRGRNRDDLIATGNCLIVEGNTWNDVYWGVCRGVGQNNLGKLIMQIRKDLQQENLIEY